MEGGIGPVASSCQHGMVMRMPGLPVCAPMTPGEWTEGWERFMRSDDPLYMSEHRKSFKIDYEMENMVKKESKITLFAISSARLSALDTVKTLEAEGVSCDLVHLVWLKPFEVTELMKDSLKKTGLGLVIDSDFEISGPSRSIAFELMHETGVPVHALGLEDRTAGFAPHLDNGTPSGKRITEKVRRLLQLDSIGVGSI